MLKSIHRESYRLLCTLLVERRKTLGWSQYDLAERLQRPQSFVAKVEVGERRIDVVEFLDLVHALEADPYEILRTIEAVYCNTSRDTTADEDAADH